MVEPSRLKVLLVAEEAAGVQVLRRLLKAPVDVVTLTSVPEVARGATVWHLASKEGIEILRPRLVARPDFAEEIARRGIDLLLNVHSLAIAAGPVVAAPRIGSFNLHPGPLPRYAGLNGPSWAILNGESEYGVTLHWMDAEIDTGDIAYQTTFEVEPGATGIRLASRCVREGVLLVDQLLAALAGGAGIPRTTQDLAQRSYFGRSGPAELAIRWEGPARRIEACVRAADYRPLPSPWGSAHARCDGERLDVVSVELTGVPTDGAAPGTLRDAGDHGIQVACGDEWLALRRVGLRDRQGSASGILAGAEQLHDG